jgi:hypothetical protein
VTVLAVVGGAVVVLLVVVWAGNRMVRSADGSSASVGDVFGAAMDVFEPGRAQAREDLFAKRHEAQQLPDGDGDHPVSVDLTRGTARIRRAR